MDRSGMCRASVRWTHVEASLDRRLTFRFGGPSYRPSLVDAIALLRVRCVISPCLEHLLLRGSGQRGKATASVPHDGLSQEGLRLLRVEGGSFDW